MPHPDDEGEQRRPLLFRDFIAAACPGYGFHTWAERLISLLQLVAEGRLGRLIVCCPPRLGKSLLVSRLFPAYWLSRYPQCFCAIASYSAELAYAHSREARHHYRSAGFSLSRDCRAVGNWLTPGRGGCIAAGVRGPFTGKGYGLGIIDDPYKGPEDANSASQRRKLIEWFQSVWLTRAEPAPQGPLARGAAGSGRGSGGGGAERSFHASARQVVVLTRWHREDLIGWLLEQEGGDAPQHWHVLNLPAIAEPAAEQQHFPDTCSVEPDWRQPGEPLCPERFPARELEQIRSRTGSYWWAALYQQRPAPAEGLLFQRQWLRQCPGQPALPRQQPGGRRRHAPLVLSCDLSFKGSEASDHCGFCLLGRLVEPVPAHPAAVAREQGQQLHRSAATLPLPSPPAAAAVPGSSHGLEVLWSQRQRLDLPGVVKFLIGTLNDLGQQGWSPDAVLIEDSANGPAVCQLLQRQIPGLIAVRPRGGKLSRAHAVAPLLEAGQLAFRSGNDALQSELLGFPHGADDDLVDAFCQGVIWLENRHWPAGGRGAPSSRPLLFSR